MEAKRDSNANITLDLIMSQMVRADDDLSVTILACRVPILACLTKLIHCPCGAPKEVFTSRSEPDEDLIVTILACRVTILACRVTILANRMKLCNSLPV
jgi:hypothetical protein